MRYNRFENFEI